MTSSFLSENWLSIATRTLSNHHLFFCACCGKDSSKYLLAFQNTYIFTLLPPATKLRQGNVFRTCLSFCSQVWGCLPDPPGQTPLADTPRADNPPPADTPPADTPPCPVHARMRSTSGRYASYWNAFLSII